jgi:L-fuculose-phosphate aldolase
VRYVVLVSHDRERAAIIEVGLRLYEKGLVTATEGNISMRVADGHLVTASGVSKGSLTPELVIFIDHEGHAPSSGPAVSSEDLMHLAIYRRRPDVHAVVHAHPPAASAFAVAHLPLDSWILAEAVVVLGKVPLTRYATPGTAELADIVAEGLGKGSAALLANHGAITVGETLTQAHYRMETLEHVARVAVMARLLGGARELSSFDVDRLLGSTSGPYRWPR